MPKYTVYTVEVRNGADWREWTRGRFDTLGSAYRAALKFYGSATEGSFWRIGEVAD